jgi:DNA-binding MarR family transcriptional regulator
MQAVAATQTTSPALDAFVRLVRAHAAVTRLLSAQLQQEHGLTINAYEALLQLSRAEEPMRRVDLANSLLLTASGVTRLLDGLERGGLIARKACPSDARASYTELTDAGWAKLRAASGDHIAAVRALLEERFEDEELDRLASLLDRLPGVDPAASGADCAPDGEAAA